MSLFSVIEDGKYQLINIMAIQKITNVSNIETTQEQWWITYNSETKIILQGPFGPFQCSGYTSSPHTMVIADTEAEVLEFIEQEGLTLEDTDDGI